jgi:hypothetical protein
VIRTKTWALATGAAALAAAATMVAAAPASAVPKPVVAAAAAPEGALPAGFADWTAVYAYQQKLSDAAGLISAADPGNASIVAAPGNHELRVYWKGAVPAVARSRAAGSGVKVAFHPAAYTHEELVKQARQLVTRPGVYEAAPAIDGSGLTATVGSDTAVSGLRVASAVPLTVTVGQRPEPMFSRQADISPYFGGSRWLSNTGGSCSTGIPLHIGDALAMQTAGHCAEMFTNVTVPGVPGVAGSILGKQKCQDIELINFSGGVSQSVYTGSQTSSTSANIKGAAFDFAGSFVTTSGASSGEHLNIPIQATDVFGTGVCGFVGPLTRAGYSTATCAVAPGDSGGPVYSPTTGGVLVRGTISLATGTPASCPGSFPGGWNTVWWTPAVRPFGSSNPGTLDFYRADVPYVTASFVGGKYTDGTVHVGGPKIQTWGDTITVDMSAYGRPTAHGNVLSSTVIQVTYPDDRTHVGNLISDTQIRWDDGTTWTRNFF